MSELTDLPTLYIGLVGLAVLIYALLDGYDLGVGILLPLTPERQHDRNQMIASIGPFWDANETWLVLAVGLLLIAFPEAHNLILKELYLASSMMLLGIILRGVAFDFRTKAVNQYQRVWELAFKLGSILTALAQGYMLGRWVLGFDESLFAYSFALMSALCVSSAYTFIGACWLILKTENELQIYCAAQGRKAAAMTALGLFIVSLTLINANEDVFSRWFSLPHSIYMLPIPFLCACLFVIAERYMASVPHHNDTGCWIPFLCAVFIFIFAFQSLAMSFYPWVIPQHLRIAEAASDDSALGFLLYGVIFVMPCILAYSAYSYRVFWGKTRALRYD